MRRLKVSFEGHRDFDVIAKTNRSEAAIMEVAPHDKVGGPGNQHPDSDQWMYVLSGEAEAIVNDEAVALYPGVLLLIEAGDRHEIRNPGDHPLRTLNIYGPPAY